MKYLFKEFHILLLTAVITSFTMNSCSEDETVNVDDPVASFQFEVSETNSKEVTFTNFSQNASSYSWEFGDGEMSTEENPVHLFAEFGTYTVTLTATNSADVTHQYSETIEITDPNAALAALTGGSSKTWKLYREGTSMGVGPDEAGARSWWSLENDGSRPCIYKQSWTFNHDGTFEFDDAGVFWGEGFVFEGTDFNEICFPAEAANMVNKDGADVSAWLSGTHSFSYDPATKELVLEGNGAWIGLTKVTPGGDVAVPQASVTYTADIEEMNGYDLMTISVAGDGFYWNFSYASYENQSDEPEIVETQEPFGEDLPDLTPTEMYYTFAAPDDRAVLDTSASGSQITLGVDDPAGGDPKVGEFYRTEDQYQELQFKLENDILFDNFTTVSLDVYIPSSNDYSGTLTKDIQIIIAESSETEEWWTGHYTYDVDVADVQSDIWQTWTFQISAPTGGPGIETEPDPTNRTDLDLFAIALGGAGHTTAGTFYVRNFKFE